MRQFFSSLKHSLASRLLLVFIGVCLCVIVLLVATLASGFGSQWKEGIKPHLNQYLSYVNADIGNPPNIARAEELASKLPINIYIDGPEQNYSSTGAPLNKSQLDFPRASERWNKSQSGKSFLADTSPTLSFGEMNDRTVLRNQLGDYTVYYEVLHGHAKSHRSGFVWRAFIWLFAILAGSYWLLRHMLKPVHDIKLGVERMGSGELDYRVPKRADNDLGDLSTSINHMAQDIEQMLSAKRQLLLSLSHELRSPITRAKIAVQMLDESAAQGSIEEDLNEMQALISEILEAERLNGQHAALNLSLVDLNSFLQSIVSEYPEEQLSIAIEPALPQVSLDDTRTRLLLRNLINNAITHSKNTSQQPLLSASVVNGQLKLSVQDFGSGIAEQHLPHLTEAFYRADSSRVRTTGGFGLGLHLCKLIAEAHGGKLVIQSTLGKGSTMTFLLDVKSP